MMFSKLQKFFLVSGSLIVVFAAFNKVYTGPNLFSSIGFITGLIFFVLLFSSFFISKLREQ
jgi:hypothetical protein